MIALTLEKVRAGVVPIPSDRFIEPLTRQARDRGLDVRWSEEGKLPVALIRYQPANGRSDVVLERLAIRQGQIRLSGRSDRMQGAFAIPILPSGRVIQLNLPKRNSQRRGPASTTLRNSTSPTS